MKDLSDNKKMIKILFLIFFLFITTSLHANEEYIFFDIELGKPLKSEKILTGENDLFWEVFKPIKKNSTFDYYLLTRGPITKAVYGIQLTGPQESFGKCIVNKREFWDPYFEKKYPVLKKELIANTETQYSHKFTFENDLEIVTQCLFLSNLKDLYISIYYNMDQKIKEDDEYFKKLRKKELSKNDLTGFNEN